MDVDEIGLGGDWGRLAVGRDESSEEEGERRALSFILGMIVEDGIEECR